MNIGVNTLFLIPGEVGGSETYLTEVLHGMLQTDEDFKLTLFTNDENSESLKTRYSNDRRVSFVHIPLKATSRPMRILVEQFRLPRYCTENAVDVLWSPGYVGPLRCPCPTVVTIHDMQYKRFPEDLTLLSRLVTNVLVKLGARTNESIITISEFSKREILHFTSANESSVFVTLEAADSAFGMTVDQNEIDSILPQADNKQRRYILCVANSYPHKNLELLVRAFGKCSDMDEIDLVIVGKPRLGEQRFQAALQEITNANRVTRLLRVNREQLIALYQRCAVFAFPSLYEGFGLPVLEAMVAGVPVVTTGCASISEIAGEAAIYSKSLKVDDFAAALREGLSLSAVERRNLCDRASERSRQFSWKKAGHETLQILRTAAQIKPT